MRDYSCHTVSFIVNAFEKSANFSFNYELLTIYFPADVGYLTESLVKSPESEGWQGKQEKLKPSFKFKIQHNFVFGTVNRNMTGKGSSVEVGLKCSGSWSSWLKNQKKLKVS